MEITPEQKVTSDNFKAHLLALHNELETVSSQLADKMKLRDETSAEVDALCHLREKEAALLKKISADVLVRDMEVVSKEKKLRSDSLSFEEYKKNTLKEITQLNDEANSKLSNNLASIESLKKEININKEILSTLQYKCINEKESLGELSIHKSKLENDIGSLENKISELSVQFDVMIQRNKEELFKWDTKLEEAKMKVELPLANLKQEENEFYKALNNLEVRKRRMSKYLKKYFPDEVLKI